MDGMGQWDGMGWNVGCAARTDPESRREPYGRGVSPARVPPAAPHARRDSAVSAASASLSLLISMSDRGAMQGVRGPGLGDRSPLGVPRCPSPCPCPSLLDVYPTARSPFLSSGPLVLRGHCTWLRSRGMNRRLLIKSTDNSAAKTLRGRRESGKRIIQTRKIK